MEDKFLKNTMMLLIERDIVATINTDSILNNFKDLKKYIELLFYKLSHILYCVLRKNDFVSFSLLTIC